MRYLSEISVMVDNNENIRLKRLKNGNIALIYRFV